MKQDLNVSGVYCWLNLVNGKRYIGSAVNIKKRNADKKLIGSKTLRRAIRKYGEENFSLTVLIVVVRGTMDTEQLKTTLLTNEQFWMDFYESYKPENGYNIASKAGNNLGMKFDQESRKLASESANKRWKNLEQRELARAKTIKHFESEQARMAVSDRTKRQFSDPEQRKKRSESQRSIMLEPERRRKNKEGKKKYHNDHPEVAEAVGEHFRRYYSDPENRKKNSERCKELYKNPEKRARLQKQAKEAGHKAAEARRKKRLEDPINYAIMEAKRLASFKETIRRRKQAKLQQQLLED